MILRRVLIGLGIVALVTLGAWWVMESSDSSGPVEIRCGRVITQPQVVAPFNAALILAPDGTIWGWGENSSGLLGPIQVRGRWNTPRRLDVGSDWVSLAAGGQYALGIKADGSLWGWTFHPSGVSGQLGPYTNPPVRLAPGTNWVAVASGAAHALARRADGTLWAWGQNYSGQVGGNAITNYPAPMQLGTNRNWIGVAASAFGSLGLQSDGSLWQWGLVHMGFGEGPDVNLSAPARVGEGTNWVAISGGDFHFTARQRDGSLWVWGPNAHLVGSTDRQEPFRIDADTNWSASANGNHLLALKRDGTLWSCGREGSGETGRTPSDPSQGLARIGERQDWMAVWAGPGISFGMTKDGTLWTWGVRLQEQPPRHALWEKLSSWLPRWVKPVPSPRQVPSSPVPWPLARFVTNSVVSSR